MRTLAASWFCVLFACWGHTADPMNPRFLVAVDTSFSTSKQIGAIRNIVADLVVSGFGEQIRAGEEFEVWGFSERIQKHPAFVWKPDSGPEAVRFAELALSRHRHRGKTEFRLLTESVSAIARLRPTFTFVLITDGEDELIGTPFDSRVNRAFAETTRFSKRDRQPFVIVMLAENGAWTRCTISDGGLHIEIPAPQPLEHAEAQRDPSSKPTAVEAVASALQPADARANKSPPALLATAADTKSPATIPPVQPEKSPVPGNASPAVVPQPRPALETIEPIKPAAKEIEPAAKVLVKPPETPDSAKADSAPLSVSNPAQEGELKGVGIQAASELVPEPKGDQPATTDLTAVASGERAGVPEDQPASTMRKDSAAVAGALLAPGVASEAPNRAWVIGFAFAGSLCLLLAIVWVRARSQPIARSSLISQCMDKGGTSDRPEKL